MKQPKGESSIIIYNDIHGILGRVTVRVGLGKGLGIKSTFATQSIAPRFVCMVGETTFNSSTWFTSYRENTFIFREVNCYRNMY